MRYLLLLLLLVGCSGDVRQYIKPTPTGDYKLDVYIQKYLEGVNITLCQYVLEEKTLLDGYFCFETLNDENEYYVPIEEWIKDKLKYKFILASKENLREKHDSEKLHRDFLCRENPPCNYGELKSMPELQKYKQ